MLDVMLLNVMKLCDYVGCTDVVCNNVGCHVVVVCNDIVCVM